jgi:hypothetical protein
VVEETFEYDASNSRLRQTKRKGELDTVTTYLGGYEKVETRNAATGGTFFFGTLKMTCEVLPEMIARRREEKFVKIFTRMESSA